jgi:hypothetical protein
MYYNVPSMRASSFVCLLPFLLVLPAGATSVPRLSFEAMTDRSELVLSGQITRSWTDWDAEHKFIWTHHEIAVSSAQKGAPGSTVIVSEPGGMIGDLGMSVAGSVAYAPGDHVAVFLERMPNGYLRTAGWGQGKYTVDKMGRLHGDGSLAGIDVLTAQSGPASGTSIRSLDGMTVAEFRARVAARVQSHRQRGKQ